MQFKIIMACDAKGGIGLKDKLPWKGTEAGKVDMWHFRRTTSGANTAVIMGYNTYLTFESPLPNRTNIVTTSREVREGFTRYSDFNDALQYCKASKFSQVFVIGGAALYNSVKDHPLCEEQIITVFKDQYQCDLFVNFPSGGVKLLENMLLSIISFKSVNTDEVRYLDLLRELLVSPIEQNRTGTPAYSQVGHRLTFQLRRGTEYIMPILTTKKMDFNAIYWELMWFLRGDTSTKYLIEHGVNIWNQNTTREALDSRGLVDHEPGELGPGYGFQWRNYNGDWKNSTNNGVTPTAGVDQIARLIANIKKSPFLRTHVVTAWNPCQLGEMALEPCHVMFQMLVDGQRRLSCVVTMRSGDEFLGKPYNVVSYAILTHIIAAICGLIPHELIFNTGSSHLYVNCTVQASKQVMTAPYGFPTFSFATEITEKRNVARLSIDDFTSSPEVLIKLINYYHHPGLPAQMIA